MSRSAHDEVADQALDATTIRMAREAAKTYQDLKIVCPWCRESVIGNKLDKHLDIHFNEMSEREAETPSHWMAL